MNNVDIFSGLIGSGFSKTNIFPLIKKKKEQTTALMINNRYDILFR